MEIQKLCCQNCGSSRFRELDSASSNPRRVKCDHCDSEYLVEQKSNLVQILIPIAKKIGDTAQGALENLRENPKVKQDLFEFVKGAEQVTTAYLGCLGLQLATPIFMAAGCLLFALLIPLILIVGSAVDWDWRSLLAGIIIVGAIAIALGTQKKDKREEIRDGRSDATQSVPKGSGTISAEEFIARLGKPPGKPGS